MVLIVGGWACGAPDRPASLPGPLPPSFLDLLEPDSIRSVRVGAGIGYWRLRAPAGPWVVHLLDVDLARCELAVGVIPAEPDGPGRPARAQVSRLASGGGRGVVAAVNGDFFTPEGDPVGPEISGGKVLRAARRPAFAWRPGSGPWIGTSRTTPDSTLHVGWPVAVTAGDGVTEAVGGFPELLDQGTRVGDLEVAARPAFAAARHPRTAVGFAPDGRTLWLLVVDGRREGYSAGMTLPELAATMEALGATEALNLDGGGSSVMVLYGRPVSRPSDAEGERPVANALAVRRNPTACRRASR